MDQLHHFILTKYNPQQKSERLKGARFFVVTHNLELFQSQKCRRRNNSFVKNTHMADTFMQVDIMLVFATKYRDALIEYSWDEELYKYITGIVQNKDQKMLAIDGDKDHIHIFLSLSGDLSIAEIVREVKKSSTNFVNNRRLSKKHFRWQSGYGAFSYSRKDRDRVINYIKNQKEHHSKENFKEEFKRQLKEFDIEFKEGYLFDFFEEPDSGN